MASSLQSLFSVDRSSFGCFFSSIGPDTSIYVNRNGEVKKFCWFTTLLWTEEREKADHRFVRLRILHLVQTRLRDLYSDANPTRFHYAYKCFLAKAEINEKEFRATSDPVTFSQIDRIRRALDWTVLKFDFIDDGQISSLDQKQQAKAQESKVAEKNLVLPPSSRAAFQ